MVCDSVSAILAMALLAVGSRNGGVGIAMIVLQVLPILATATNG